MQEPTGRSAPPAEGTDTPQPVGAEAAVGAESAVSSPPVGADVASSPVPGRSDVSVSAPGAPVPSSRASIEALTSEVLPALIARLSASDLGELEVRTPAWRVRLRKAVAGAARGASRVGGAGADPVGTSARADATLGSDRSAPAQGGTGQPVMSLATDPGRTDRQVADPRRAAVPDRQAATSPAVGYFSPRDEMRRGQRIQAGDLLGVVDVLGVRHEVTSPIDGFVSRQIALAGEAVEYGQPLVEIEGLPARGHAAAGAAVPSAAEDTEAGVPAPGGDAAVVVGEAV